MSENHPVQTRRRVLQSLGATSAAALAGCGQQDSNNGNGNGGGQQKELGERVPQVVLSWYGTSPRAPVAKKQVNIFASNLKQLGVESDIEPMTTGALSGKILQDKMDGDVPHVTAFNKPQRIDPHRLLTFVGMIAGIGPPVEPISLGQYTSCKYRDSVFSQSIETKTKKRQKLVTEAMKIISDNVGVIPTTNLLMLNALRTDKIEPSNVGKLGANPSNVNFFLNTSPTVGNTIVAENKPGALQTIQPTRKAEGRTLFNNLIHSSISKFNENLEVENYLADSIEKQNNGKQITVELVDGATFHNGDAVTAEDVKWSFEYVLNYPGGVRELMSWPHESIEIIDEKTVQFNQKHPSIVLPALNFIMVGIWHKESLIEAGATENPTEYQFSNPTDMVGSGPFKIESAEPGSSITLVPFDNHPIYSPDHKIIFRGFKEKTTAVQSFKNGDLHTVYGVTSNVFKQLEQQDSVQGVETQGWTPHGIYPQMSAAPSKFKEFRRAVSVSLNRAKMNQISQGGLAEPQLHGGTLPTTHPWHEQDKVPNIAESPQGDTEAARQILSNAGWGWDDNDNLHYPPDADLTRRWPKGEGPDPADYPCLGTDEEGTRVYVPPDER